MRRDLLLTTILAATIATTPAAAQCVPDDTGTVTCEGTDTDGFASEAAGTLVTVLKDASVSSSDDAIAVTGEGSEVDNQGSVTGGDDGVVIGAGGALVNAGTITGGDLGVNADDQDGVRVVNTGTISGGDRGVRFDDGADAVVENDGLIEGVGEGIEAGADARITNAGTIRSTTDDDGLQVATNGEIVNRGQILGGTENGDGIDLDSGLVVNEAGALIESRVTGLTGTEDGAEAGIDIDDGDGVVTIENLGTIRGEIGVLEDRGNTAGHTLVNAGAVVGTGGVVVDWDEGDDTIELIEGGTFEGVVSTGLGDDDLFLSGIMDAVVGGDGALFDGGEGEDLIGFDPAVRMSDIVGVAMSAAFEDASELTFLNADGSRSLIVFRGFELFEVGGLVLSLSDLPAPVPLPGAALIFVGGLGVLSIARRRA